MGNGEHEMEEGKTVLKMPSDFASAVKDIKLAILQSRAKAARLANGEALKLYFFVGGYISKKTRNAKWGSGAIDALSNQLQVELPGLRGVSSSSMIFMRLFYEAWTVCTAIRNLVSVEFHYLPSNELPRKNRQMPSDEIRTVPLGEMANELRGIYITRLERRLANNRRRTK